MLERGEKPGGAGEEAVAPFWYSRDQRHPLVATRRRIRILLRSRHGLQLTDTTEGPVELIREISRVTGVFKLRIKIDVGGWKTTTGRCVKAPMPKLSPSELTPSRSGASSSLTRAGVPPSP